MISRKETQKRRRKGKEREITDRIRRRDERHMSKRGKIKKKGRARRKKEEKIRPRREKELKKRCRNGMIWNEEGGGGGGERRRRGGGGELPLLKFL